MTHTLLALSLLASLFTPSAFRVEVTGQGRPMILIPGLSSDGETWDTTVDHFKGRFECHVLTVAGFAGVPRVQAPVLETVVEELAAYIREHRLEKPVIVGHSLGGFIALQFAIKHPELVGPIVNVDGYTHYLSLTGAGSTAEDAKIISRRIREGMGQMTREAYDAYVKSGLATRHMVTTDADFQKLVAWGLASDPVAVANAMSEMYAADLRQDIARITSPTLVLAAWQSYAQYTDHDRHMAALQDQFKHLPGVQLELNDTARHFIMWDDPQWMFEKIERFLGLR